MPDAAERPSCLIKTLPPEMVGEAARVAAEIEPRNRPAVAQFASLVPGDESDRVTTPAFIAALTTKYWGANPRVLPVSFLDGPDRATIDRILAHMNAWAESGCISFAWSQADGKVRITRVRGGYWSYLGTDILMIPPGQPTMNLEGFTAGTPEAEYRRIVRHETGHLLGFPHEHMRRSLVDRLDVERTVAYFGATQGWSRRDVLAQVLTPLDEASLMSTPADEDSIMCYQLPAEITTNGRPIPGGDDINDSDRAFAATIYPKPAGPAPPVSPPAPAKPPIEPPKPPEPEEVGPIDLAIGRVAGPYTLLPGQSLLFRFRARAHRVFLAQTADDGTGAWKMALLSETKDVIKVDEDMNGKGGNAVIARALRPGVYHLRVQAMVPELSGVFRVKVS